MPAKLELEHHLLRYVPWARLRKDENDNVLGVVGAAFALRENEEYLSATWAEFFTGSLEDQVAEAIRSVRASKLTVGSKSGFAVGTVQQIDEACVSYGYKVRFLHEPEADNEAHAALRRWPREADELFELLAEDAWGRLVLNSEIPPA